MPQKVNNLPAMQETWVLSLGQEDMSWSGEGIDCPFQYSCLENSLDRRVLGIQSRGVTKSWT